MDQNGLLAVIVDKGCEEYCNRGATNLYPLTKHLDAAFDRPAPMGELFLAKVSTLN
jgi:hypothetical protein